MRTLQTSQPNRESSYCFQREERGQTIFCPVKIEVQEKQIEMKITVAITEAALILDETSTTVERNCRHLEAKKKEIDINGTCCAEQAKPALTFEKENVAFYVNKTCIQRMHKSFRKWKPKSIQIKLSVFKRLTAEDARASFSTGYAKILRGPNIPVDALFEKLKITDTLIKALIDSGISVNLKIFTLYKQLENIYYAIKNIIAANNGKIPVKRPTAIRVQPQNFISETTVLLLVTEIDITPCSLGIKFLYNFEPKKK